MLLGDKTLSELLLSRYLWRHIAVLAHNESKHQGFDVLFYMYCSLQTYSPLTKVAVSVKLLLLHNQNSKMLRDFYIYIWWAIDLGGRFGLWFDEKQRRVSLEGRVLIHYSGVIINAMASQIIGVSINCSTFCSGSDQRKHQSSASLAFLRRIHRRPVNSHHKGPVTWKMFPFDAAIT